MKNIEKYQDTKLNLTNIEFNILLFYKDEYWWGNMQFKDIALLKYLKSQGLFQEIENTDMTLDEILRITVVTN